jgi:hypothetical protein
MTTTRAPRSTARPPTKAHGDMADAAAVELASSITAAAFIRPPMRRARSIAAARSNGKSEAAAIARI